MADKTKTYSNEELTIVWKPDSCIHSEKCWRGLTGVFNPKARPWINASGAATAEIKAQIDLCPSGALSYHMNKETEQEAQASGGPVKVEVLKNGPLMIHSTCEVLDTEGNVVLKENRVAMCRCGASANKPYCDGGHKKIGFEG